MNGPENIGIADPGVAVVLGSAFLGIYAHGGFLAGLNEAGIFPGHISGASAGAMAGGFYAAGLRESALENAILSPALKRSYAEIGILFRGAPMFFFGRLTGVMSGKKVVRHLKQDLPVANIEDTPGVLLNLVVTDIRKKESVFLTRGPLAESMMASCAVPVLFTGQILDGVEYHDGGIVHELPIEPYIQDPAIHTIIVHKLTKPKTASKKSLGVSDPFSDGHQMLNDALFAYRRKEAERNGKRVIFIETEHPSPGIFQNVETKKRFFEIGRKGALALAGV